MSDPSRHILWRLLEFVLILLGCYTAWRLWADFVVGALS